MNGLTLTEKAALLSGANVWQTRAVERLGIPALFLADGPHGLRKQLGPADHLGLHESEPATCFPTAAAIACSWDVELAERIGAALGAEAAHQGVNVVLGPGLNVKRSPLGGRNFEYFSEDPLLSGRLAAGYVRGIQSAGVAATPKHFAANSQELRRMVSDSIVDERTLRELYLTGFEIVVREARPWALMSSYNLVGGVYANEHEHLLRRILREEWGFDGAVITDWGGGNDAVEGVRAGSSLEMPSPGFDSARAIVAAVEAGELDVADVDARVDEVLTLVERTTATASAAAPDLGAHHRLARRAAADSAVLLRNEGDLLPLAAGARVAVIGDFARTPRYQGAGSSAVNPVRLVSTLDAIGGSGLELVRFAPGFRRDGAPDAALRADAVAAARAADAVLLFLGLPEIAESEGVDREHLRLPDEQVRVLREVAEVNPAVVVVLSAGGVVEMTWIDCCAALVHGHLGGQAGAEGMLDVLTGAVTPSGRLAETVPERLADTPTAGRFPSAMRTAEYREGPYVGYRYYETAGVEVSFPFGFGLSYTSFAYEGLRIENDEAVFTVRNTGAVAGAEVAQLYVARVDEVHRPALQLGGFAKVRLEPGEAATVRIALEQFAFRVFDTGTGTWRVVPGDYDLRVGASVRDIRLSAVHTLAGTGEPRAPDDPRLEPYRRGDVRNVTDEAFSALLGAAIPSSAWPDGPLGRNDPLVRLSEARSPLARLVHRILESRRRRAEASGAPDLNILFLYNMPFRAIGKMTGGAVTMEMVDALLLIVNGRHSRGIGRLVRGWLRARAADRRTRRALAADGHTR